MQIYMHNVYPQKMLCNHSYNLILSNTDNFTEIAGTPHNMTGVQEWSYDY